MAGPYKTANFPAVLLALVVLPLAITGQAAEYSLGYGLEARYEYNDNVRLSPENEIDVSGGQLILPVSFTRRSERLEATVDGRISTAKYDDQGYNSDDQNLQTRATYKLERGELQGNAGFLRDSTRDSEFTNTGVVGLTATRKETGTAGGSGYHMFTEKNGLTGGVSYSDVDYQIDLYQDFEYITGYAGWLHQWSQRTQLRLQGYANSFENDARIKVKSDGLGAQAGIDSKLSENLSLSLLVGWIETDTSYSTNLPIALEDDDEGTYLVEGSLKYRQERYQLRAKVNSSTSPSGDGYLLQRDQLDLSYRYRLTELSNFDLVLIGGHSSSLDSAIDNDRDYARVRLRLDYRFSRQWYVAGTYTYSYQDNKRAVGDADSNAVYLSLIFKPEKHFWSR